MGPQGNLAQKLMKPETTSRPSLLSFQQEQQLAPQMGKVLPVRSPAQAAGTGAGLEPCASHQQARMSSSYGQSKSPHLTALSFPI